MTVEEQKMIVRRFFEEARNQKNLDVVDDIFAPTVIFNGQSVTREALKQALAGRRVAFPDIRVTVDDQVAEGDKVSTRRTWRATHRGPYRGVAPTGKQVTWTQNQHRPLLAGQDCGGLGRCGRAQHLAAAGRATRMKSGREDAPASMSNPAVQQPAGSWELARRRWARR